MTYSTLTQAGTLAIKVLGFLECFNKKGNQDTAMEEILCSAELRVTHQMVQAHEVTGVIHLLVVSGLLLIHTHVVCSYLCYYQVLIFVILIINIISIFIIFIIIMTVVARGS